MASINQFRSQTEVTRSIPTLSNMDEIDHILGNLRFDMPSGAASSSGISLNIMRNEDLMTVRVPITTVKALSKIHNISPSGTQLRFYFAEGKPTKVESPIGTYGIYTICLRNGR